MIRLLTFIALSLLTCACVQQDLTIIAIENGALKGVVEDDVYSWKGIPYAQPPVGELRWKPPVRLENWKDIRDADTYGNICMQIGYGEDSFYELPPQKMSEDCLYLNVWTQNPNPKKKLPVFVWIHGGSLTREGGTHPQYLGKNMAKKGILYVSINYRLNAFGFMAHPALSKENNGVSGNYGIMDQIAALEWIQRNISSFGGDPNNVTIAGESAGGWSVTLLTATDKTKGLFHKAIAQSGAYLWPGPHLHVAKNGYASGEDEGQQFMERLGAKSLAEVRSLPAEKIRDLFFSSENNLSSEPLVDGEIFKDDILELYRQGKQNQVDVITGANAHEYSIWIPENLATNVSEYKEQIKNTYSGRSELFFEAYPVNDSSSIAEAYMNYRGDKSFHLLSRSWARFMAQEGNNVFMYYFSKTPSERYPKKYGAFHGAEIVYALDNLENDPGPIGSGIISKEDQAYATVVSTYWANFVKTGNPNEEGLAYWPQWSIDAESFIEFGETVSTGNYLLKQRLDAFQKFLDAEEISNE